MSVNGLDKLDTVSARPPACWPRSMCRYGVEPEHYQPVGGALLWTLEKGLGDRLEQARWPTPGRQAYTTLSGFMISEAYPQTKAAE